MIEIIDTGNPNGTYSILDEVNFGWTASSDTGSVTSISVTMLPFKPNEITLFSGSSSASATGKHQRAFELAPEKLQYLDINEQYVKKNNWEDMPPPDDPSIQEFYLYDPSRETSRVFTYIVTATSSNGEQITESYSTTVTNDWTEGRDFTVDYTKTK